ncbi:alpha-ketoacid dehydrogenase subunit beta [Chloroflexota bacterium]
MTTVLESLNIAMQYALASDERVVIMGEDILDPYGGAFKVTRGLSDSFPDRVITTPISEAGIVGVATGMAMRGLLPVVEIMFGDFITLIADQVINHAAKFRWMYNNQVRVPIVIRTPMGGRRGYGPTHSQTLEKFFIGVPGLRILAPNTFSDPGDLLLKAIFEDNDPVLFIENKLLYLNTIHDSHHLSEFEFSEQTLESISYHHSKHKGTISRLSNNYVSTCMLSLRGAPPPVLTIAAYGYMSEFAYQAALKLAYEYEVITELVYPTQLSPCDMGAILSSASHTGRLLVVEEGTHNLGWGAEVIALTAENLGSSLQSARRVAALNLPIPASGPLEEAVLPGIEHIIQAAQKMV